MRVVAFVLGALVLGGCGGDEEFTTKKAPGADPFGDLDRADLSAPGNARLFASSASAPNVLAVGLSGLLLGSLSELDEMSTCPETSESGTTIVISGGCTDADGNVWFGKATMIEDEAAGKASVEYDGFGMGQASTCKGANGESRFAFDGRLDVDGSSDDARSFVLQLEVESKAVDPESCAVIEGKSVYDYEGTFEELAPPPGDGSGGAGGGATGAGGGSGGSPSVDLGKSRWNGSGKIGYSTVGFADVKTEDEVVDSAVCDTEALSGTTTVESSGDTAVITYDGATDCEETSTVTWTLNGEDQGELTDVRCSYGAVAPHAGDGAWIAALAALAAFGRRRRTIA